MTDDISFQTSVAYSISYFLCMMKMAYTFLIEILMERRLSKYIFYDRRKFKRRTLDHNIFNRKSNYLFKDAQYAESVLISHLESLTKDCVNKYIIFSKSISIWIEIDCSFIQYNVFIHQAIFHLYNIL